MPAEQRKGRFHSFFKGSYLGVALRLQKCHLCAIEVFQKILGGGGQQGERTFCVCQNCSVLQVSFIKGKFQVYW